MPFEERRRVCKRLQVGEGRDCWGWETVWNDLGIPHQVSLTPKQARLWGTRPPEFSFWRVLFLWEGKPGSMKDVSIDWWASGKRAVARPSNSVRKIHPLQLDFHLCHRKKKPQFPHSEWLLHFCKEKWLYSIQSSWALHSFQPLINTYYLAPASEAPSQFSQPACLPSPLPSFLPSRTHSINTYQSSWSTRP